MSDRITEAILRETEEACRGDYYQQHVAVKMLVPRLVAEVRRLRGLIVAVVDGLWCDDPSCDALEAEADAISEETEVPVDKEP
jgi:hypothetical protein